jgi:bifunctional non-homologous end joining protein LigD
MELRSQARRLSLPCGQAQQWRCALVAPWQWIHGALPGDCPGLRKAPVDTLIDGEVIVVDHTGKVSFNGLQHSRPDGHIQFYAFDVLIHRGRNVLRLPIEERRLLLTEALRKVEYPVIQSTPFDVKPAELIRAAKELEFEGVIAKRKGSLYEPGRRTGAWVKYKLNRSQEFVIGGYTAGNPFDAPIVGCYDDCRQDPQRSQAC